MNLYLSKNNTQLTCKFGDYLAIFLLLLATYLLTAYWLSTPRTRDIGVYAVIAHGLLEGKLPYIDLWDHKPPAIYLAYAFSELVAGYGDSSILFLSFFLHGFFSFRTIKAIQTIKHRKLVLLFSYTCLCILYDKSKI